MKRDCPVFYSKISSLLAYGLTEADFVAKIVFSRLKLNLKKTTDRSSFLKLTRGKYGIKKNFGTVFRWILLIFQV